MYKFHLKYFPGKLNAALDCTSRYSAAPKQDDTTSKDSAQMFNSALKASFNSTFEQDPKLKVTPKDSDSFLQLEGKIIWYMQISTWDG